MKPQNLFGGLAALSLAAAASSAQPVVSPEIHADRSVTFRFSAPTAREVVLNCEALPKSQPLQKDAQGVWSFTTQPVEPDIYIYSFLVDGQRVLDPANPNIKYNLFSTENQLDVPGGGHPWEIRDVPHGVVHRHHYRSAIVGEERQLWVYTPPGYDAAAAQKYPVLYLLHGFSDAEDAWVTIGRADVILDNLIASGAARPMIVVMPRGYGNRDVVTGGWIRLRDPAWQDSWRDSNAKYARSLLDEIVPLVEKNYRTDNNRQARAIAGLSMGGTQSLLTGLNAADRFAWIAAFSSGGLPEDFERQFPAASEALNDQLRLLWIACGTEDGLVGSNRKFVDWLKSRGVRPAYVETPGHHSFRVWRRYLAEIAQKLFQPAPASPSNPARQ